MQNAILTGLRGVGKTVLLETLKPIAQSMDWLWTGNDLSESASISEERIATRVVTDLSALLAPIFSIRTEVQPVGFAGRKSEFNSPMGYENLRQTYDMTPGLVYDKLKAVLVQVGGLIKNTPFRGIVFAYDEAQNLADHSRRGEYPLSVLLDVFQSIQKSPGSIPFMLALTGLPTLFPKLTEARTYSERMFHVMFLDRLNAEESREAIIKPVARSDSPVEFSTGTVNTIVQISGGYPYFIQFICREMFDIWIAKIGAGEEPSIPTSEIIDKLDQDFFSARWERATDRQRQFMNVIASLPNCEDEFSVQEIVSASKTQLAKPFSPSHTNQLLNTLASKGLVYRNRHGKYSFAVPLLSRFIKRQFEDEDDLPLAPPSS